MNRDGLGKTRAAECTVASQQDATQLSRKPKDGTVRKVGALAHLLHQGINLDEINHGEGVADQMTRLEMGEGDPMPPPLQLIHDQVGGVGCDASLKPQVKETCQFKVYQDVCILDGNAMHRVTPPSRTAHRIPARKCQEDLPPSTG